MFSIGNNSIMCLQINPFNTVFYPGFGFLTTETSLLYLVENPSNHCLMVLKDHFQRNRICKFSVAGD